MSENEPPLPPAPEPEPEPEPTGAVNESELEPVTRDRRFLFRVAAFAVLGLFAALIAGAWLKGAAASCGASLIRPGSSVIPPR